MKLSKHRKGSSLPIVVALSLMPEACRATCDKSLNLNSYVPV